MGDPVATVVAGLETVAGMEVRIAGAIAVAIVVVGTPT